MEDLLGKIRYDRPSRKAQESMGKLAGLRVKDAWLRDAVPRVKFINS